MKPALFAATATKTVQAATVNKSLQFRRRLRDFFAPVWGLPLVAVYVAVHDKIRSEGFAVAANISRRSGGAFIPHFWELFDCPSYNIPGFSSVCPYSVNVHTFNLEIKFDTF